MNFMKKSSWNFREQIDETKDLLLEFISNNHAIKSNKLLECLIELKQINEVESFIESLKKNSRKRRNKTNNKKVKL